MRYTSHQATSQLERSHFEIVNMQVGHLAMGPTVMELPTSLQHPHWAGQDEQY